MTSPKYKRVVLKLSGEALAGDQGFGIYPSVIKSVAAQVKELAELGVRSSCCCWRRKHLAWKNW